MNDFFDLGNRWDPDIGSRWPGLRRRAERRRNMYASILRQIPLAGTNDPARKTADLQATSAAHQIESAERTGRALTFATWALVFVTLALVAATVALIVVTARQ